MKRIIDKFNNMCDKKYADFQSKLIPTIDKKTIIGVRTPGLKAFAKEMLKVSQCFAPTKGSHCATSPEILPSDVEKFLNELPHKYFDENQFHAFILSEIKDFDICIKYTDKFLPYIDNWATCDQLSPKCFKKNKDELLKYIYKWIKSKKPYIIRFAIGMLMSHFLDEDFDDKYLKMVADVNYKGIQKIKALKDSKVSTTRNKLNGKQNAFVEKISIDIDPNKYYVEMMRAWYFATALAKQFDATFPYIKNRKLNIWTHNKAIQKARESFRVCVDHKKALKVFII